MPMSKGVVAAQATVSYTDTGGKGLLILPRGAIPLGAVVQVETAFNDSGTDYLDLGAKTAGDRFANNIDVSAQGSQIVPFRDTAPLAGMVEIMATYTGQNGDANAGKARVSIVYATPFEPR